MADMYDQLKTLNRELLAANQKRDGEAALRITEEIAAIENSPEFKKSFNPYNSLAS